jgi:DNA-binding SARP family transcriptional activator/Tfp pilus assembly protein PilF/TolB-like protein
MMRVYTLGRFELMDADGRTQPVQPKRLALLAYLAAATPRGAVRRDIVLALFWPELGQAEARRALRQALHYLRGKLGAEAIESRAEGQLGLNDAVIWCDVIEFERAAADHTAAEAALRLFGGEFLAGVYPPDMAAEFEEWLDRTRARLRTAAARAAWRLADEHADSGAGPAAAAAAERALELAPDDEATLRRALELLIRIGDRGRALRTYDLWAQRLQREFDATPSAETSGLIERILAESHHPARTAIDPLEVAESRPIVLAGLSDAGAAPGPSRRAKRRRSRALAAVAVALVGLLSVFAALRTRAPVVAGDGEPTTIVVADFASVVPDPSLVRALGEIVRTDMAQSRELRVLSPMQVRDALQRMTLDQDALLSDSIARELAVREGVRAIVTGEVSLVAGRFVLAVRLVSPTDGSLLAAFRQTADSSRVIEAMGRLTHALRLELGESLRSVRSTPRLSSVTTASLPALRAYSDAMHESERNGNREAAIALLERAVELDPGFAGAYRMLGALHSTQADPTRARAALQRAVQFKDRLPLRERYLMLGSYHRNVTREYDRAIEAYEALLKLYPRNVAALNNLSLVYADRRAYAQSERLLLRAIAVDSTIPVVYLGLGQTLINQGRFDDAASLLFAVDRRFPDHAPRLLTWTYLNAARQDWDQAERFIGTRLEHALQTGRAAEQADALQTLGQILMLTGRADAAERTLRAARELSRTQALHRRVLFTSVQLGWLELRYRNRPAVALALLDSVLDQQPLEHVPNGDRPYRELAELLAALGAREHLDRLAAVAEADPDARLDLDGPSGHALRGFTASVNGSHRVALRELRLADAGDRCPICVLPALGEIHERTGDAEAAISAYRRYVDAPWMWRFESDAAHLGWVLLRLMELYGEHGRASDAEEMSARLRALWRRADPDLRLGPGAPEPGANGG